MDTLKREVLSFSNFPPDIWAYIACYLRGENLITLKMTGARLLWRRLSSYGTVKSVVIKTEKTALNSGPAFLHEFPTLDELIISQYSPRLRVVSWKLNTIPSVLRKLQFCGHSPKFSYFLVGKEGTALYLDEHLPHLESLDVLHSEMSDYSWMARCPATLTKLRIPWWDGSVELPSSLIHLEMNRLALKHRSMDLQFPPQLETFATGKAFGFDLFPPSLQKLRTLKVEILSQDSTWAQTLPRGLTSLSLGRGIVWSPEMLSHLPPSITELDVSNDAPASAFPFEALPKAITRLASYHGESLVWGPPRQSSLSYSLFPPQLTYLTLSGAHLSPEAAQHLPPSLISLTLPFLANNWANIFQKGSHGY